MKTIMIFLMVLLFSGCSLSNISWNAFPMPEYNIEIEGLQESLDNENTPTGKLDIIAKYVYTNVKYTDADITWKNPAKVWQDKRGCCKHLTILWMWLAYQYCGYSPGLIIVGNYDGYGHAYSEYKNYVFNKIYESYDIRYTYTFEEAIKKAEYER